VSSTATLDVTVLPDTEAVAERAAATILERACSKSGRVAICLSGGSTPRLLYERLAAEPYRGVLPWPRMHWFWGDERFVPADDERSNQRMVRHALFDKIAAPADTIHPIRTEANGPEESAIQYEEELKGFYGSDRFDPARALFDVTLLGLGEDGHTASLFPGSAALEIRQRWAVPVPHAAVEPYVPRITLTLPTLASSRVVLFLVTGTNKREVLTRILGGSDLPAARVHADGQLQWLVDRAAAPERRP
jgi:6-phosphogluconolactonase